MNSRNLNDLKNRVDSREVSRGRVRKVVGLTVAKTKTGWKNYFSHNEESFIAAAAEIECGHVLPLDTHALAEQLQCAVKSVKCQSGDKSI